MANLEYSPYGDVQYIKDMIDYNSKIVSIYGSDVAYANEAQSLYAIKYQSLNPYSKDYFSEYVIADRTFNKNYYLYDRIDVVHNKTTGSNVFLSNLSKNIDSLGTYANDYVLGLGGPLARDIARYSKKTDVKSYINDVAKNMGLSGNTAYKLTQSLKIYANFAAEFAQKSAFAFLTAKVGVDFVNQDYEAAALSAVKFIIANKAYDIGAAAWEATKLAAAAGEFGSLSIADTYILRSALAKPALASLIAYVAVKDFELAWQLTKEIHSGRLQDDYGWFLDQVKLKAIETWEDIYEHNGSYPDESEGIEALNNFWSNSSLLGGILDIADWLKDLLSMKDFAEAEASPLVLDLDGDGIELSATGAAGSVYFDLDNDGFGEATGWVRGGDGLLALDRNGNGVIDDKSELFGDTATAVNGFEGLKTLDSNLDGRITSADQKFASLRVWIDANADGISQASELRTLSSLGITAINTAYTDVNKTNAGHAVLQEGTFIRNGVTRQIADVWFSADQTNAEYLKDYTLDVRTLFLPTLRGYGNLADLHIAMSMDNTAAGNLLGRAA